jgi:hypothetical protein
MVKKGKIDLRSDQWNDIGEACVMLGHAQQPTKMECFFAILDNATAALSHVDGGTKFPQQKLAFTLELKVYKDRFKTKDCIEKLNAFKCNQASVKNNTLLTTAIFNHILDAYAAYVTGEGNTTKAGCAPDAFIKHLTHQQVCERLLHCGSFCHNFISYNPFHDSLEQAYLQCQEFYNDHWKSFQAPLSKTTPNSRLTATKFSQFKDHMMELGIVQWFNKCLEDAGHHYWMDRKGCLGGFLVRV